MLMNKRDFRNRYVRVDPDDIVVTDIWYRSPLWDDDHLLGADFTWKDDGIAWCGRGLEATKDWDADAFGGLWLSERRIGKCRYCLRRQREWDGRNDSRIT